MGEIWDSHADWWRVNFTRGADPEYEDQIIPLALDLLAPAAGELILDAGCGEGHITRAVAASGARPVGCDSSAAQTAAARSAGEDAGPSLGYVRARLEALPFDAGSVDAVLVVLVLEHVANLEAVVIELSRVLRMGGRLVVFLNHPLFQTPDSGWVDDHILEERYWRVGDYLNETETQEEVDPGVILPFYHRPLSRYLNALVGAGITLDRMLEPAPPARFLAAAPAFARSPGIPRLAVLAARRTAGG